MIRLGSSLAAVAVFASTVLAETDNKGKQATYRTPRHLLRA